MTPKKTARSRQSPLPLDGYIRVSRVGGRGGEGFISPEVQEQGIREWERRSGREVVIQEPELNVSGGTMDRPIFNRSMQRVRDRVSGGIVVFKSDRFARSLIGAVTTLAELGEHDAAFASATEPQLDYSTPAGRAFLHMLFVFAEFVRATIKESWATSQRMAVERGIHISPYNYLGYDTEDGRLVPNEWAPIAREVFERRRDRQGWGAIATWLNEVGAPVPTSRKKGGKRRTANQWAPVAVARMCAKRVYRGEASRYVDQNIDGLEPIVNREAHPALGERGALALRANGLHLGDG
jgi:site-specific DNA recombinase